MNSSPQKHRRATRVSDPNQSDRRPFRIRAVVMSVATCGAFLLLSRGGPAPMAPVGSEARAAKSKHDSPQGRELKKSSPQIPEHDAVGTGTPQERLAAAMPTTGPAPSS